MSHNYSDIGAIKIDAYINTAGACGRNYRQINGFDVVRGTLNEADGKCSFVMFLLFSNLVQRHGGDDIYEN